MPERIELEYIAADDKRYRPVMIHRAPFGSMERFVAVLIEHTGGKFPLWLTPDQAVIIPVSEKYNEYAKNVLNLLNNSDIRTLIDDRNEKVGKKIRDKEMKRIPYLIVVGENEQNEGTLSVRKQGEGSNGEVMKIDDFVAKISQEVAEQMNEMK